MLSAIILYGSKARNDHDRFSDTDLLGISLSGGIQKPFEKFGISFHVYPEHWLINEAREGSLFLLHITGEAVAIFDPFEKLSTLRAEFIYKDSYRSECEIGLRIVAAVLDLCDEEFTPTMRRRYFWGLRTALMANAADHRSPIFSAKALESSLGLSGLSLHIQTRADASLSECQRFGGQVFERIGIFSRPQSDNDKEENLRFLFDFGGIGTATSAEIIYNFKPGFQRS